LLTCKVGNSIINCFDGTYDKFKLKKWSEENRLICPICNGTYEYCHGEFISPYFRHKEKDKCEDYFSEPETEEHIQGKRLLYEWLQKQKGIENLQLEAWIPETRQRPDLYFEQNGKRFVVEYQCSPIASEYIKRHELYQLAGINDVWVMGTEKYNINISNKTVSHDPHYKVLEKHSFAYLDIKSNKFVLHKKYIKDSLSHNTCWLKDYYAFQIIDVLFDDSLKISDDGILFFIEKDKKKYQMQIEEELQIKNRIDIVNKLIMFLNNKFSKFDNGLYYYKLFQNTEIVLYKKSSIGDDNEILTFFVGNYHIDCCGQLTYSDKRYKPKWTRHSKYKKVRTITYDNVDFNILKNFILECTYDRLRFLKYDYIGGDIIG